MSAVVDLAPKVAAFDHFRDANVDEWLLFLLLMLLLEAVDTDEAAFWQVNARITETLDEFVRAHCDAVRRQTISTGSISHASSAVAASAVDAAASTCL